jgi:cell wall-associated NlpC family hydrolase
MRFLLLLAPLLFFSACSTRSAPAGPESEHSKIIYGDLDKLYPYHNEWHLTPYKFGGFGPNGIDCSAFVQRAYRDLFRIDLPRTTRALANYGEKIPRSQIRTSDLVFFKTGYNSRHVGIYLKGGDFMHTSSKYGIIISNMDDPYWHKRYWMTRRVK